MDVLGLSQRRALIVGVARSSFQRAHKHAKDVVTFDKYAELRQWLHTWAAQNPRWGYRRAWIKTKEEGFDVGRDVARRVWRQENLGVPSRKRSKPKTLADPTPRVEPAACPNDVWALDFQFDSDYHGRSIKVCNVMDELTREHVGFTADSTIDAAAVVELLDVIACERGQRPRVVRRDNGPEFISKTLQSWAAEEETVQAFIPPGQPWHNGSWSHCITGCVMSCLIKNASWIWNMPGTASGNGVTGTIRIILTRHWDLSRRRNSRSSF